MPKQFVDKTIEIDRRLRFTVADVRQPELKLSEEDGISYELERHDGSTELHVRQGDFAALPEGEKYRRMTEETWDRVLPKIKALAEGSLG